MYLIFCLVTLSLIFSLLFVFSLLFRVCVSCNLYYLLSFFSFSEIQYIQVFKLTHHFFVHVVCSVNITFRLLFRMRFTYYLKINVVNIFDVFRLLQKKFLLIILSNILKWLQFFDLLQFFFFFWHLNYVLLHRILLSPSFFIQQ